MRKLCVLLALCLLLGAAFPVHSEDQEFDITSEAVELAVPEEEVALGGEPEEDAGYADFIGDTAVEAAEAIPVDAEHFTYSEGEYCFLDYVQGNIDTDGDGVLSEAERLAVVEIKFGFDDGLEALDGLQYFPNLEVLNVNQRGHKPGLRRLDVSHNTKLKFLGVNWNSLESLDLSNNTALEELCYYRGGLAETLDLSACTALKVVDCDRNSCLRNLILGDKPNLEKLECDECSLTELDLSGCPNLVTCYCASNTPMTKLNVNGCYSLRTLDCRYNPELKELDICDCVGTLKTFNHNASLLVITTRPTVEPTAEPTPEPTATPEPTPTPVPVGGKFKDATGTYRLGKDGAVTFVKPAKSAKTVTVPATVKVNGKSAKVTAVGEKAFYRDAKLTAITIGKYVKTVGKNAFYGCKKLKAVKGGAAITTIRDGAFRGCAALTTITLNSKVTTLGKKAFYGCAKLKTVTIKTAKLTTKTVGAGAFKGIYAAATFKCPAKKLAAYKKLLPTKGAPKKAKYK